ncbi:MAG: class I SAM-dependent methyltransferase [Pseudomonadota bacterium]|nr:class I SAM-dependent methyltransferase [Pseudomonadota bacterium]
MNEPSIRHSPAAERNRAPILTQLQRLLPASGAALEIAAGSGQHAAHFAAALPGWQWWPSEGDAASLASIDAWCAGIPNVQPPLHLNLLAQAAAAPWAGVPAALHAVYCANLLHIAPWATCAALMQGAAAHLVPGGQLVVYGPFIVDGEPTADGNRSFDIELRQLDPQWGLRRLADVQATATAAGLQFRECVAMPANNLLLVFAQPT